MILEQHTSLFTVLLEQDQLRIILEMFWPFTLKCFQREHALQIQIHVILGAEHYTTLVVYLDFPFQIIPIAYTPSHARLATLESSASLQPPHTLLSR